MAKRDNLPFLIRQATALRLPQFLPTPSPRTGRSAAMMFGPVTIDNSSVQLAGYRPPRFRTSQNEWRRGLLKRPFIYLFLISAFTWTVACAQDRPEGQTPIAAGGTSDAGGVAPNNTPLGEPSDGELVGDASGSSEHRSADAVENGEPAGNSSAELDLADPSADRDPQSTSGAVPDEEGSNGEGGGDTASSASTGQPDEASPTAAAGEDRSDGPQSSNPSGSGQVAAALAPGATAPGGVAVGNNPPAWRNLRTNILLGVVLATLAIASIVGQYLQRQPNESVNPALVRRFRQRVNAWWLMCAILVFGLLLQPIGTVVLFGLVSFWALREFITMAPTRRGDHRALFWALIVFTPLQYLLIGLERSGIRWRGHEFDFYGLYSIMIPVYASLFVPARIAIAGDHKRFLERSAQVTAGLLICVYSLSYAPALINLQLTTSDGTAWDGSPAGLLFFFILVSQLSDFLQWCWGHWVGRRVIAPEISTSRTWEGFAGGTLSMALIGAGLFWVTPFTFLEAACMAMVVGVMGMFGGMTMSAIKRDRGVNDYGSLVMGHAGVLDRIDTLCFAAPVFYHLTRFLFSN